MSVKWVKPASGDIYVNANNHGTVFLYLVAELKTVTRGERTRHYIELGESIADSLVFRRKRYFSTGTKDNRSKPVEAKDTTPRKLLDKKTAGYILGKYLPDHMGKRIWTQGYKGPEYLGRIKKGNIPKKHRARPLLDRKDWTFVPGAILVCSWGYDQTNIDFYEITKRKGHFCWIQEIGQKSVDGQHYMTGKCLPDTDRRIGKEMRKLVQVYDGKEQCVKISSFSSAHLWDGRWENWTAYA